MFRFLVDFTKVIVIACIIGVSLRVIDIVFLKEKTKDVAISNTINEIQNEEILEIVNDEKDTEEQTTNETKQEIATVETKKELDLNQDTKIETKEEDKKEEQQETSKNVSLPETTKQEVTETEKKNTEVKEETTNSSLANTHFTKYNAEKTAHAVSYLNGKIQKEADYNEYGGKAIGVTKKPCKNWFSYSYDEKLNSLVITGSTLKVYVEDEYRYDTKGTNYYLYDTKAYIYTE